MPRLFYTATSCGAASFIVAHTAQISGIHVQTVDLGTHKTSADENYFDENPKGNVPALMLDDGTLLNENVAVLLYLGDAKPEAKLTFAEGTPRRYELINALAFIASEIHPTLGVLFYPSPSAEVTAWQQKRAKEKLRKLCDLFLLKSKTFLVGEQFTVADAYLYIILSWVEEPLKLGPLSDYAEAKAFYDRVKTLPNVQAAHKRMAENPKSVV